MSWAPKLDYNGMRKQPSASAMATKKPIVCYIWEMSVLDLDDTYGYSTYPGWDPQYHSMPQVDENGFRSGPADDVPAADDREPANASMLLFAQTPKGVTVTALVQNVGWDVYFRLHDAQGHPFSQRKIAEFCALLRKTCGDNSLQLELVQRYQTSGFAHDSAQRDSAGGRPVRKKLLFGQVTFRSVRAFDRCKQANYRFRRTKQHRTLWRPEELNVGQPVNKVIDKYGITPSSWAVLRGYELDCVPGKFISHDTIEVRLQPQNVFDYNKLHPGKQRLAPPHGWICSFDIETTSSRLKANGDHRFPDADVVGDRIIQIGIVFSKLGQGDGSGEHNLVLCLGETARLDSVDDIVSFGSMEDGITDVDEGRMLAKFAEIVTSANVRCMMGYNVNGFDYKYMLARARRIGVPSFWYMSPLIGAQMASRSYTNRNGRSLTSITMPGVFTVDVMERVQEMVAQKSWKLDDVAFSYLGVKKVELPGGYNGLFRMWEAGSDGAADDGAADDGRHGRGQIAAYCVRDCQLPAMLSEKLNILPTLLSYSTITYNTPNQLLNLGVTAVLSVYMSVVAHRYQYIFTTNLLDGTRVADGANSSYTGGKVFDPVKGAHSATYCLDFASLYPSIMKSFCLSYDMWIPGGVTEAIERLCPGADVRTYPTDIGDVTYINNPHDDNGGVGLLPLALNTILNERSAARAEAKLPTTSEQMARNLEIKQKRLKVLANSLYGLLGGKTDTACTCIAATITYLGRTLITRVKELIESYVDPGTGAPLFQCVYGDTDSVFVKLCTPSSGWQGPAGMDRLAKCVDTMLCDEFCAREYAGRPWRAYQVLGLDHSLPDSALRAALGAPQDAGGPGSPPEAGQLRDAYNAQLRLWDRPSDGAPRRVEYAVDEEAARAEQNPQEWAQLRSASRALLCHAESRSQYDTDMRACEVARAAWAIELENEELFTAIWFFGKKQYIGLRPDGSKMIKGIAIKRSDISDVVKQWIEAALYRALDDSVSCQGPAAADEALRILEQVLKGLITNGISYSEATISNKITKPPDCALKDIKTPHGVVAKLTEMNTGQCVCAGDRVNYVYTIVSALSNPTVCSHYAQDPGYAEMHNIPLDVVHILKKQLWPPIKRFLSPVCDEDRVWEVFEPYVIAFEKHQEKLKSEYYMSTRAKRLVGAADVGDRGVTWPASLVSTRPAMPQTGGGTKRKPKAKHKQPTLDQLFSTARASCVPAEKDSKKRRLSPGGIAK